jgi:hypothetical protein
MIDRKAAPCRSDLAGSSRAADPIVESEQAHGDVSSTRPHEGRDGSTVSR